MIVQAHGASARMRVAAFFVLSLSVLLLPALALGKGDESELCFGNLPDGARVEVDGLMVDAGGGCLSLAPGTYLVTVFPEAAPPFEAFVELLAQETKEVRYLPPTPALQLAHPELERRSELVAGPALVGASVVLGLTGAAFWMMANQSASAEALVLDRDDLSEPARRRMLDDLSRRKSLRREVATVSAALATGVLIAGGAAWAIGAGKEEGRVLMSPAPGGATITVRLP